MSEPDGPHRGGDTSASVRRAINARLDGVVEQYDVRILFASESGSRAWGFPSPDSDYDVRFVYAHDVDWYLSLDARRDVIELPIEDDLDINGWDLRKAMALLLKPNPVLIEWLQSPIVYRADDFATGQLVSLAERTARHRSLLLHYLHLGQSQFRQHIDGRTRIALKRYFYVLRPALALRWLRRRPAELVPMALPQLLAGVDLPPDATAAIDDLVTRKARSRELGDGPRSAALDAVIRSEFEHAESAVPQRTPLPPALLRDANSLFRRLIQRT